jgi:hypothetical protein
MDILVPVQKGPWVRIDMPDFGLRPPISAILAKVEHLSGCPVMLIHDPSLATLATVKAATRQQPVHQIRYRSEDAEAGYRIAFESGFLLRLLNVPTPQRVQLASRADIRKRIIAEASRLNPGLPAESAARIGTTLYDGLMTQLRSCGPGMAIDLWLFADYPELRGLQAASLEQQARGNAAALNPAHDRQFPADVVRANRAMNSAYALFAADLLNRPELAVPYQAAGLERIGRSLLATLQDPARSAVDQLIVDDWAAQLGISGWYEWVPAEVSRQDALP